MQKNEKFLLRRLQPLDFQTKLFPAKKQDFMNKSIFKSVIMLLPSVRQGQFILYSMEEQLSVLS